MHIIFTRVGLEEIGPIKRSSVERTKKYCQLWLKCSSAFYTAQTKAAPFMVAIQYSPRYEGVVRSFTWPEWVKLTTHIRMFEFVNQEKLAGQRVLMSRLDADDSYSVNFFEALETEPAGLLLHKRFKQFNMATGELTAEMRRNAPHFATLIFDQLPSTLVWEDTAGIDNNHKHLEKFPHRELGGCFCLERVTGFNVGNFWKHIDLVRRGKITAATNPVKSSLELDPSFVGYR